MPEELTSQEQSPEYESLADGAKVAPAELTTGVRDELTGLRLPVADEPQEEGVADTEQDADILKTPEQEIADATTYWLERLEEHNVGAKLLNGEINANTAKSIFERLGDGNAHKPITAERLRDNPNIIQQALHGIQKIAFDKAPEEQREQYRRAAGILLGLMIDTSARTEDVGDVVQKINLKDLQLEGLHFLGYGHRGFTMEVEGRAGNWAGKDAVSGSIALEDVGDNVFENAGGTFTGSFENAGDNAAVNLREGANVSGKNVVGVAGDNMTGGTIAVDSLNGLIGDIRGGEIRVKDRKKTYERSFGMQASDGFAKFRKAPFKTLLSWFGIGA